MSDTRLVGKGTAGFGYGLNGAYSIIGFIQVAVKRADDDEPFAVVWEPVYINGQGRKVWRRPRIYKRGGHGVQHKPLYDTEIKCDERNEN